MGSLVTILNKLVSQYLTKHSISHLTDCEMKVLKDQLSLLKMSEQKQGVQHPS